MPSFKSFVSVHGIHWFSCSNYIQTEDERSCTEPRAILVRRNVKVKKETEHFESPEKIQVCQVNEFSATSKGVRSKGENQPQKVSMHNNPYGKKWHKTCQ